MLSHNESSACGSVRNVLIMPLSALFNAWMGSPYMEPEVSNKKYTGSLLILFSCHKFHYTTIFNSEGGGGNSLRPVTSLPPSSTFVEVTPIEAVTQAKNFEIL